MRAGTPLHTSGTSIATASVELRVVRVGRRDMSLAVFRQLPELSVIEDGTDIWGWVNYHWSDCSDRGYSDGYLIDDHIHGICAENGVLYRISVNHWIYSDTEYRRQSNELYNDVVKCGQLYIAV